MCARTHVCVCMMNTSPLGLTSMHISVCVQDVYTTNHPLISLLTQPGGLEKKKKKGGGGGAMATSVVLMFRVPVCPNKKTTIGWRQGHALWDRQAAAMEQLPHVVVWWSG